MTVKNLAALQDTWVQSLGLEDRLQKETATSSVGKESTCDAKDPSSIPGSRRSPGEGIGYPLHYSWASLVAQLVKNLPAMWETWVQSLGPVFWPGEFHVLYSPWGCMESDKTERLLLFHPLPFTGVWKQNQWEQWACLLAPGSVYSASEMRWAALGIVVVVESLSRV